MQAKVFGFGADPIQTIENQLQVGEMEKPILSEATDILIEVVCSAISWVDLMMMCGVYQHKPRLPYTPGLEYSGRIIDLGEEAKAEGFQLGDRVFVDCFTTGPRTSGVYQKYGGLASYAIAPFQAVNHIPKNFNFAQACNFLGNYETAYHALVYCAGLQKGDSILIHGASGGTGLAAVHIAKAIGAHVIATGRSAKKLEIVQEQGADDIVVLKEDEAGRYHFREAVRGLLNERGVDVVYDGVGGKVITESLRTLRFEGCYLVVGWASTPFIAKEKQRTNLIPSNLVLMKGLRVLGSPAVISAQKDPDIRKKRLKDLLGWVEKGMMKPYCAKIYPVSELKEALKERWNGGVVGGITVQIGED